MHIRHLGLYSSLSSIILGLSNSGSLSFSVSLENQFAAAMAGADGLGVDFYCNLVFSILGLVANLINIWQNQKMITIESRCRSVCDSAKAKMFIETAKGTPLHYGSPFRQRCIYLTNVETRIVGCNYC